MPSRSYSNQSLNPSINPYPNSPSGQEFKLDADAAQPKQSEAGVNLFYDLGENVRRPTPRRPPWANCRPSQSLELEATTTHPNITATTSSYLAAAARAKSAFDFIFNPSAQGSQSMPFFDQLRQLDNSNEFKKLIEDENTGAVALLATFHELAVFCKKRGIDLPDWPLNHASVLGWPLQQQQLIGCLHHWTTRLHAQQKDKLPLLIKLAQATATGAIPNSSVYVYGVESIILRACAHQVEGAQFTANLLHQLKIDSSPADCFNPVLEQIVALPHLHTATVLTQVEALVEGGATILLMPEIGSDNAALNRKRNLVKQILALPSSSIAEPDVYHPRAPEQPSMSSWPEGKQHFGSTMFSPNFGTSDQSSNDFGGLENATSELLEKPFDPSELFYSLQAQPMVSNSPPLSEPSSNTSSTFPPSHDADEDWKKFLNLG